MMSASLNSFGMVTLPSLLTYAVNSASPSLDKSSPQNDVFVARAEIALYIVHFQSSPFFIDVTTF
jgi:hypothetical protein